MGGTVETSLRAEHALGKCSGCNLPLPLRLPAAHEQALAVGMHGLQRTAYRGVLLESLSSLFRQNVHLVGPARVETGTSTRRGGQRRIRPSVTYFDRLSGPSSSSASWRRH